MEDQLTFMARVQNGTMNLSPDQRTRISSYLKRLEEKFCTITMRAMGKPRSLSQNNYYHACIVDMLADEWGYDHDDMHEILREKFLKPQFIEFKGEYVSIRKSTTKLSTDEFEDYCEKIRIWAARDYGITLPLPNEGAELISK